MLQITAAGLCQNHTGFPKTECGCKGTTKFADVQILSGKSFECSESFRGIVLVNVNCSPNLAMRVLRARAYNIYYIDMGVEKNKEGKVIC